MPTSVHQAHSIEWSLCNRIGQVRRRLRDMQTSFLPVCLPGVFSFRDRLLLKTLVRDPRVEGKGCRYSLFPRRE